MSDYEDALNGDKDAQERIKQVLTSTPLSVNDLLSVQKIGASLPFTWEQLAPPREPTSKTWVEVDPVELEAYKRWEKRYEALQSEGVANGWLFQGYDGDELVPPEGKWVYEYDD